VKTKTPPQISGEFEVLLKDLSKIAQAHHHSINTHTHT
jgi:hypothetical protein